MSTEIPDWREKKELLWGDHSTDEERLAAARLFLEAGRLSEALDFFSRAKDGEGVEGVLREAVEQGDWFLYKRCTGALGAERREELAVLAAKAVERGKFLFALRACQALGDRAGQETALQRLREVYPDSTLLLSQLEEESGLKPEPSGGDGADGAGEAGPAK